MSTIILLDVSLSMCRPSTRILKSGDAITEIRQLANAGIGSLLDYLAQNVQLERVALVVFSSLWEIKQEFTRHHESVKNKLYDLELYDKSNIVNAVRGITQLISKEYAQSEIVNIILVTDGQLNHENSYNLDTKSIKTENADDQFHDIPLSYLENQFDFPCKMQIVCLTTESDAPMLKYNIKFFKQLVKLVDSSTNDCPVLNSHLNTKNLAQSAIWLPSVDSNSDISMEDVEQLFMRISEVHYEPYRATIACGHLYSRVLLSPKPTDYTVRPLKNEFDDLKTQQQTDTGIQTFVKATYRTIDYELMDEINICGFLPVTEVGSPAVSSRHLVMPIVHDKFNELSKAEQILTQDPNAYHNNLLQAYPLGGSLQLDLIDSKIRSDNDQAQQKIASQTSIIETETATPTKTTKSRIGTNSASETGNTSQNNSSTGETSINNKTDQDITKQPTFCALLLNGLKQENMVGICEVGKSVATNGIWYGMLHAQTDSKKRTTLMLSLFIPTDRPILWLPSFKTMGSSLLNADLPQSIRDKMNAASSGKHIKSYSSNNVLWLDPESVQADIQKVVRHARRSVDKVAYFYKELNRIRRAAISYGFYDVLFGLAAILEREKNVMLLDPARQANQEMIGHIENAVNCLRANLDENSFSTNIAPK